MRWEWVKSIEGWCPEQFFCPEPENFGACCPDTCCGPGQPPLTGNSRCARLLGLRTNLLLAPATQVAQYPLGMSKKEKGGAGGGGGAASTGTLAVTVNADGDVNYDAIVRQGRNRDKIVYSDHKALVPKLDSLTEVGSFPFLGIGQRSTMQGN